MILKIIESLLLGFFCSLLLAAFDLFSWGKMSQGWGVLAYLYFWPILAVLWYFVLKVIFKKEKVISEPINWLVFIPVWILSFWVLLTSQFLNRNYGYFVKKWLIPNLTIEFLDLAIVFLPFVIIIILSSLIAWFVTKIFKLNK